jgi:hypothetical protein
MHINESKLRHEDRKQFRESFHIAKRLAQSIVDTVRAQLSEVPIEDRGWTLLHVVVGLLAACHWTEKEINEEVSLCFKHLNDLAAEGVVMREDA